MLIPTLVNNDSENTIFNQKSDRIKIYKVNKAKYFFTLFEQINLRKCDKNVFIV